MDKERREEEGETMLPPYIQHKSHYQITTHVTMPKYSPRILNFPRLLFVQMRAPLSLSLSLSLSFSLSLSLPVAISFLPSHSLPSHIVACWQSGFLAAICLLTHSRSLSSNPKEQQPSSPYLTIARMQKSQKREWRERERGRRERE